MDTLKSARSVQFDPSEHISSLVGSGPDIHTWPYSIGTGNLPRLFTLASSFTPARLDSSTNQMQLSPIPEQLAEFEFSNASSPNFFQLSSCDLISHPTTISFGTNSSSIDKIINPSDSCPITSDTYEGAMLIKPSVSASSQNLFSELTSGISSATRSMIGLHHNTSEDPSLLTFGSCLAENDPENYSASSRGTLAGIDLEPRSESGSCQQLPFWFQTSMNSHRSLIYNFSPLSLGDQLATASSLFAKRPSLPASLTCSSAALDKDSDLSSAYPSLSQAASTSSLSEFLRLENSCKSSRRDSSSALLDDSTQLAELEGIISTYLPQQSVDSLCLGGSTKPASVAEEVDCQTATLRRVSSLGCPLSIPGIGELATEVPSCPSLNVLCLYPRDSSSIKISPEKSPILQTTPSHLL
ncbi:unnamed protein product [Protopolystoma xenopodis]|uniref:Uncharacterized protein n=1 Tax=Protopolystoma xenopodis TaxID=117903 RepID=A0A448XJ49_9PLAT|nr:unnamed protein product [Protopolystoma xenopodis]